MPIHSAEQYRLTESLVWKELLAEWDSLPTDRQGSPVERLKAQSVTRQPIREHVQLERYSNMATQKRHSEIDSDLKVLKAYLEQYPAIRDSRTEEYKNREDKSCVR